MERASGSLSFLHIMNPDISDIPSNPGVYLFKNAKEKVLYAGKAKNLKKRVSSYFRSSLSADPRKAALIKEASDLSYIVTENELEAFVLEANLIKQHKPKFNVILRDDKNYPYIKLTVNEQWPWIEVARRIKKDGAIYYGPYVPSGAMWQTIDFIRKNFQIRDCNYRLDRKLRPCLQYQMGRCPAPCAGKIERSEYLKAIEDIKLFLGGESRELVDKLKNKMLELSDELRYEEAAVLRDRINSIEKVWESQKVVSPDMSDQDVTGFYREEGSAAFKVLFIRKGLMVGSKDYFLKNVNDVNDAELMKAFLVQLYSGEIITPPEIIVSAKPADVKYICDWLSRLRGGNVRVSAPRSGRKKDLADMASENARFLFRAKRKDNTEDTLEELVKKLDMPEKPVFIAAVDISNISGAEAVGSYVVWSGGEFRKELYRRLKIKTVQGIDDYSMMREVVDRVIRNLEENLPDMIIIDGGKGHLETASNVFSGYRNVQKMPFIISIAKKPDRVYLPSSEVPVDIEDGSPSSLLLKSLRDEAHRFAVSYHRKLRDKELMRSPLEDVEGIGRKRRLELLRVFGSIKGIRDATIEEIAKVRGFNIKIAEKIHQQLGRMK